MIFLVLHRLPTTINTRDAFARVVRDAHSNPQFFETDNELFRELSAQTTGFIMIPPRLYDRVRSICPKALILLKDATSLREQGRRINRDPRCETITGLGYGSSSDNANRLKRVMEQLQRRNSS